MISITREFAMPNRETFKIPPIKRLINKYCLDENLIIKRPIVDPFCGDSKIADTRNDIKDSGVDSLDWLKTIPSDFSEVLLYDPPYSNRQLDECYKGLGLSLEASQTRCDYWTRIKAEITRIAKINSIVITCGWQSIGIGKKNGFRKLEIKLVPHGGPHYDTIVVVERKVREQQENKSGTTRGVIEGW